MIIYILLLAVVITCAIDIIMASADRLVYKPKVDRALTRHLRKSISPYTKGNFDFHVIKSPLNRRGEFYVIELYPSTTHPVVKSIVDRLQRSNVPRHLIPSIIEKERGRVFNKSRLISPWDLSAIVQSESTDVSNTYDYCDTWDTIYVLSEKDYLCNCNRCNGVVLPEDCIVQNILTTDDDLRVQAALEGAYSSI